MAEQIQYNIPVDTLSGIYKITAPGGYYYIGSSKNFKNRCYCHTNDLKNNKHTNPILQNKFNSNPIGWSMELIEETTGKLLYTEQTHLDQYYGNEYCMNINPKAISPPNQKGKHWVRTDEYRKKLKIAMENKSPEDKLKIRQRAAAMGRTNVGRKLSAESIAKGLLTKALNGNNVQSIESNIKRSKAMKGRLPWCTGKKLSPEFLAKRTAARKANKLNNLALQCMP